MSKALPVRVEDDALIIGPVRVSFQRTLRVPEQGARRLPPGLGAFPLRRVEDFPETAPPEWLERGGVMMPVYQREAMWILLSCTEPAALQVGVGGVCAISGRDWSETLTQDPQGRQGGGRQNYVALPDQPLLDGVATGDGYIRQFVAPPLDSGVAADQRPDRPGEHGGLLLRAVGMTPAALEEWYSRAPVQHFSAPTPVFGARGERGRMRQEVYADPNDPEAYDGERSGLAVVHVCSAAQWAAITGEAPPPSPIDRSTYARHEVPWLDHYDADRPGMGPAGQSPQGVALTAEVGAVRALPGRASLGSFAAANRVTPRTAIAASDAPTPSSRVENWVL